MNTKMPNALPKKIVIVGGGAAGIELATRLGNKKNNIEVTLIDKAKTHIWKPLLHEVATGALNTNDDEVNYLYHGHKNGYKYEFGHVTKIDRAAKTVHIAPIYGEYFGELVGERCVHFDTLIISVGAESNDFGTPGVKEYAMQLNDFHQAEMLRKKILEIVYSAGEKCEEEQSVKIAIVGGGATGVELAAELVHCISEANLIGSKLCPDNFTVTLIEASARILPSAPESLSNYALQELNKRRVLVKTSCAVNLVDAEGLSLKSGERIDADLVVWAAGVKAPAWLANSIGVKTNKINQIIVNAQLKSVDDDFIYAIGDCASFVDDDNKPLPATAQVAHQQAKWLSENLLSGKKSKFIFKPQGVMVSLGHTKAVGSLMAVVGPKRSYHVEGRVAKLVYISLYRIHQCIVHGITKAALLSIGDRLRGVVRPKMKFH